MSDDIKAKALDIEKLVEYQDDTVVSREVIKKELGTVTFFAFDQGQGLSEHSAPFDAMVQIIDGEAEITISGVKNTVKKGEIIIMPANEPHALQAVNSPYKMILTMIKSDAIDLIYSIFLLFSIINILAIFFVCSINCF